MSTDPVGGEQLEQPQEAGFGLPSSFVIHGFADYCCYLSRQCRSQCQTQRSAPEFTLWLEDNLRIDLSHFISFNANLTPTEILEINSVSLALQFYAG